MTDDRVLRSVRQRLHDLGPETQITPDEMAFLQSREFGHILFYLIVCRLSAMPDELVSATFEHFSGTLTLYSSSNSDALTQLLDGIASEAVEKNASQLGDIGVAGRLELTNFANQVLLSSIRRNIALLNRYSSDLASVANLDGAETALREAIAFRHRNIRPPTVDGRYVVPIDRLYVPSRLSLRTDRSPDAIMGSMLAGMDPQAALEATGPRITYYPTFLATERLVILGDPGGGKSTLAAKIAYDLAAPTPERWHLGSKTTPFVITLREYDSERHRRDLSLREYFTIYAQADLQVNVKPAVVEYLLLNRHTMVIFDGLDELLNSSDRATLVDRIESFCLTYPNVRVIVTSRKVGYPAAPLDTSMFTLGELEELADDDVHLYASNWFSLDETRTDIEVASFVSGLTRESRAIPDLRRNPLLLGLLCSLYRGQGYLPQNRPAVYDQCASLLFERWDRSREITFPLPAASYLRPAIAHIASEMYGSVDYQRGIRGSDLLRMTVDYLMSTLYDERFRAEATASAFIEHATGRAWVFTDFGLDKDGEVLFAFTHRTFLEYFAALQVARRYVTLEALWSYLSPHVKEAEWDVVSQLAIQLVSDRVEGGVDTFVVSALALVDESRDQLTYRTYNLLAFLARCMEFLLPSSGMTRRLSGTVAELELRRLTEDIVGPVYDSRILERAADPLENLEPSMGEPISTALVGYGSVDLSDHLRRQGSVSDRARRTVSVTREVECLRALLSANRDSLEDVLSGVIATLRAAGAAGDDNAWSLAAYLPRLVDADRREQLRAASIAVFQGTTVSESTGLDIARDIELVELGILTFAKALESYGPKVLFDSVDLPTWMGAGKVGPLAVSLLRASASESDSQATELGSIGNHLCLAPPPWCAVVKPSNQLPLTAGEFSQRGVSGPGGPAEAAQGIVLLMLGLVDVYGAERILAATRDSQAPWKHLLDRLLYAHNVRQVLNRDDLLAMVPGLTNGFLDVVLAWSSGGGPLVAVSGD